MIIFMAQGRDIEYKVIYNLDNDELSRNTFSGVDFSSPAFISLGSELGGHPKLWWRVGDTTDTHFHPQSQCGKVRKTIFPEILTFLFPSHLVQDYIVTQPGLCSTLKHLPTQVGANLFMTRHSTQSFHSPHFSRPT